ncbi:hypothetical protein JW930_07595 [Candidatus Woesearchaeota archaeon]|nr:hypothetical protein [Candidatus Woesearchaeota archaeon]
MNTSKNKLFNMLDDSDIGKIYTSYCIVESIKQTAGPTVFVLNDGTAFFEATAFNKPGIRAFPSLKEKMAIKADIQVKERNSKIVGELEKYLIMDQKYTDKIKSKIKNRIQEQATPVKSSFLIKSDKLDKLSSRIIAAATLIKKSIIEQRPIIIRHHDDCDGYCAAVALEKAILPLLTKHHRPEKSLFLYYRRHPSPAPYYDYTDASKDLSSFLDDSRLARPPLVVLLDLGDLEQGNISIKKIRLYDFKIIIIDHHFPGKVDIEKDVDVFLNPYTENLDANLVTGMLCTEVARLVNPSVENINFLPALAGTGDKSGIPEFSEYLKLSGYDREFLKKWALCIDFETSYLRYLESRKFVHDFFGEDTKKRDQFIELVYPEIERRFRDLTKAVVKYLEVEEMKKFKLLIIDIESFPIQEFPNNSKIVRLAHEQVKGPRISMGLLPDSIIFRADNVEGFSVNQLVSEMKQDMPHALVHGGGHDFAGTLRFMKAAKQEIIKKVREYLKKK